MTLLRTLGDHEGRRKERKNKLVFLLELVKFDFTEMGNKFREREPNKTQILWQRLMPTLEQSPSRRLLLARFRRSRMGPELHRF